MNHKGTEIQKQKNKKDKKQSYVCMNSFVLLSVFILSSVSVWFAL